VDTLHVAWSGLLVFRAGNRDCQEDMVSRVIISSAATLALGLALAGRPTGGGWNPARMMAARPTGRMVSLWGQAPLGSMIK
jgi:hypothetical protein